MIPIAKPLIGHEERIAVDRVLRSGMIAAGPEVGRAPLAKLPIWTQQRQHNAKFPDANLSGVITPPVSDGAVHVYHQYTIRVPDDRDSFARALADEHDIATGVYYSIPSHWLPSFGLTLDLPETERASHEALSLPVHPALPTDDLAAIAAAVNAVATTGA